MKNILNLIRKVFRKGRQKLFLPFEYFYWRYVYRQTKLRKYKKSQRVLVCGGEILGDINQQYREIFPKEAENKVYQADLICEHVFDLLGSGPKKLSKDGEGYQSINWHIDFISGFSWDKKIFCKYIKPGVKKGVEIKIPWELSRFQYLNILGQAYILTKKQKYVEEFINQINDWIDNNPVCFGVNWTCTMDVAIRSVNWLVGIEYFLEGNLLPSDFLQKFYSSIYEHAKFIRSNLEYSPTFTGNHYLSNISGLFLIAVYCPFFKESSKWKNFAFKEFIHEMKEQVYDDGCNFEASTSYHRLVLEMFFYVELVGKRTNTIFPNEYKNKLKKMYEFSLYCIKPNGMIPQIGDNDNGRFFIFTQRKPLEHKYLLSLAAVYYMDSQFKLSAFCFDEEAFWVFGNPGKNSYETLAYRGVPLISKSFPNAGWYIIRNNNDYCFISCGPNGQNGSGGHAHNDKLGFELMLDKHDIVVDPGTYLYTPYPKWRNNFRSTGYHNTVVVGEMEQNDISRKLFSMKQGVRVCSAILEQNDLAVIFEGKIEYINKKVSHTRTVRYSLKEEKIDVYDVIVSIDQADVSYQYCSSLLLSSMTGYNKETNTIKVNSSTYFCTSNKKMWDSLTAFYSPGYGQKEKVVCLKQTSYGNSYDSKFSIKKELR